MSIRNYRRQTENKKVHKNITIPGWLNYEAEKENINFSQTLQDALIDKLNIKRDEV